MDKQSVPERNGPQPSQAKPARGNPARRIRLQDGPCASHICGTHPSERPNLEVVVLMDVRSLSPVGRPGPTFSERHLGWDPLEAMSSIWE